MTTITASPKNPVTHFPAGAHTPVPELIPFTLEPSPPGDAVPPAPTFTPGPWFTFGQLIKAGPLDIAAAAAMPVPGGFCLNGETYANGFLIAAAPDLLNALKAVSAALEWHESLMARGQDSGAMDIARAAIAKAEGRP